MTYYLSNAERKGTESVIEGKGVSFLMKMDSKIRYSVVFIYVTIILKLSELIY